MKKEDCRKGMIVSFGADDDFCRGVVKKVNPKMAKVTSLDNHRGRPPGLVWRVPYSMLSPVVGGEEIGTEMAIRSFANPDDQAVKDWAANLPNSEIPDNPDSEDKSILEAIHELYVKLEHLEGQARVRASNKINLLFRALGREVSKESVARWKSGCEHGT